MRTLNTVAVLTVLALVMMSTSAPQKVSTAPVYEHYHPLAINIW